MTAFASVQKMFGNYIRELRQKIGLHIEQLAEKSGLSGNHLTAIERGEVNLNLETILILAMSLDTNLQELLRVIAGRITRQHITASCAQVPQADLKTAERTLAQIWIGSVEVRPLKGCTALDYSQGAFANIVTWAIDARDYERQIAKALAALRLFAVEIDNPEPVERRRTRDGEFDESMQDVIFQVENHLEATVCGPFFTFDKADC